MKCADLQGVELQEAEQQLEVQSLVLARLLGSVGNIAQSQLVHLEVAISKELKRRRLEQEGASPRKKASNHKKVYIVQLYISVLHFHCSNLQKLQLQRKRCY